MNKPISIVIPVYNEKDSLKSTVDYIYKLMADKEDKFEIILIDDGSTDGSSEIIAQIALPNVKKLTHPYNRGYGATLKSGIKAAAYDYILIVDADGSYPLNQIPLLLQEAERYDMVVGARIGNSVDMSFLRKSAKYILNQLANYLSETKIPDLNSGLRLFKKDIALKFFHILPSGFSFTTTLTLALLVNDYNIKFVSINYHKRIGKSKFRPFRDTFNFVLLIIRTVLYFNPLKIFLPISFILFIAGLSVLFYSFYFLRRIMDVTTILFIVSSIQVAVIGLLADLIDKRIQQ